MLLFTSYSSRYRLDVILTHSGSGMLRVDKPKVRRDVRKRSVVWRFFSPIGSGSVRCLLCSEYQSKQCQGSTTAMLRHLRVKHPKEVGKKCKGLIPENTMAHPGSETDGEPICSVEVTLEDVSDNATPVNESNINSAINATLEAAHKRMTNKETNDDSLVSHRRNKRSLIWRYFDCLDGLDAARCHICMKKLQCCESGGTSNLRRHLSNRHPEAFSGLVGEGRSRQPSNSAMSSNANGDTSTLSETVGGTEERVFSVEVELEDGVSDSATTVDESHIISAINGTLEAAQEVSAEQMTNKETKNDSDVSHTGKKWSLIWRHFEHLESLEAARCRICKKKLQCFEGGSTSNLRRHMSSRHPEVFSRLLAEGRKHQLSKSALSSNTNGDTCTSRVHGREQIKLSEASDREKRALRRERELIEALRRAQKEEAQALEHQRELLEKLRAADAREAAAEREKLESLRKAQQEEAKDLSRQREELQKEKAELQKKWEELQQERDGLLSQ